MGVHLLSSHNPRPSLTIYQGRLFLDDLVGHSCQGGHQGQADHVHGDAGETSKKSSSKQLGQRGQIDMSVWSCLFTR